MLIDGIIIPSLELPPFAAMRRAGLTAATYMSSIWEEPAQALHNISHVRAAIRANSDEAILVRSCSDIAKAEHEGKVGLILGWQNTDGFGSDVGCVPLFHDMGLRVVSLCFNYSNASGSGCYEPLDGGLTALGHEMVAAMNEVGILIDLTHVGDRTAADAIARSREPVCYTHAGSRTLLDNVRNKSDEQLKSVADTGGVIGIASLPHFLPRGLDSTVEDYVLVVKHVLSVVGEDHVAMGSDLCPGQDQRFFNYAARRKGFGPVATSYDRPPVLQGFSSFADYARVLDMLSAALGARQLDKFKSENWLRVFKSVWTA